MSLYYKEHIMSTMTIFAIILFVITYVLIFTQQKARPYIALASAAIFVIVGSIGIVPEFKYTLSDALHQIDWNVLMMIAGTMGTVYLFIESGMPSRLSEILVSKVHTVKWLVVMLSLFAGIISAFVDNVATVLMIAPVAVALCKKLKISPVPVIICIAISSNLQGAATLVGDTTSLLLAKAAHLDFSEFFFTEGRPGMFWVTEAGALASAFIIIWMFRDQNQPININDKTEVKDKVPTILLLLTIVSLIAVSPIQYASEALPGEFAKPEITNGIISMGFFIIGLIYEMIRTKQTKVAKDAVLSIDYYTILLLVGLFVVIGGIDKGGVITLIGELISGLSGDGSRGSIFLIYSIIVWASVLASAFIDNIPYTATMLPVVAIITERLNAGGANVHQNLLFFGLLVGATLGGNLTPIGASANITGIGILRKEGYEVSTKEFTKFSVPFTLAAVITGYLLVWLIWS